MVRDTIDPVPSPHVTTVGVTSTDATPDSRPVVDKAMAALLLVLLFWSIGPSLSKRVATPALVTVFYRMWLAVPLMWTMAASAGQRPRLSVLRVTAAPGAMFGINLLFFFSALHHSSIANVLMVSSLQPAVMLFVSKPLFGSVIRLRDVGWTAVAVAGAVFAVLGSDASSRSTKTSALGIMLSVGAMLAFTAYFALSKMARGNVGEAAAIHPLTYMAGVVFCAAVVVTPVCVLSNRHGELTKLTMVDVGWLVLIVSVPSMGHVVMTWCHRFIAANVSSMVLLIQPVTSALVAWPLNGERITWQQCAGAVVVLAGVAGVIRGGSGSPAVAPTAEVAVVDG